MLFDNTEDYRVWFGLEFKSSKQKRAEMRWLIDKHLTSWKKHLYFCAMNTAYWASASKQVIITLLEH